MRALLLLLLLASCKEETRIEPLPAPVPEPTEASTPGKKERIASSTQTATATRIAEPAKMPAIDATAKKARDDLLRLRADLAQRVRTTQDKVDQLNRQIAVTSRRNERRSLLTTIGKAKGDQRTAKDLHEQCERAFASDTWQEAESTWSALEEVLDGQMSRRTGPPRGTKEREDLDASSAYFIRLVEEIEERCQPTEAFEMQR